jgi:hypothetical protein
MWLTLLKSKTPAIIFRWLSTRTSGVYSSSRANPPCLLVFCIDTARRVATVPCGADADDVFYDARRGAVYIVCGEGLVTVVLRRT